MRHRRLQKAASVIAGTAVERNDRTNNARNRWRYLGVKSHTGNYFSENTWSFSSE